MTAVPDEPIRVALADDHTLFRKGIRELLATEDGFEVVGEASSGDQAIAVSVEHRPDVLLLDVEMPGPGVAAVIGQVRRLSPRTRVVVLTMHDDPAVVREVFESGAVAYLTKAVLLDDLVAAVRSACRDAQTVTLSVSRRTLHHLGDPGGTDPSGQPGAGQHDRALTHRERQVIGLVAQGLNNTEIAGRLRVTHATVKRHLTNAYAKLDATSRADAVRRATEANIIDVGTARRST